MKFVTALALTLAMGISAMPQEKPAAAQTPQPLQTNTSQLELAPNNIAGMRKYKYAKWLVDYSNKPADFNPMKVVTAEACEMIRWGGTCIILESTPDTCTNVPPEWERRFRSVRMLGYSYKYHKCRWYTQKDCVGIRYIDSTDKDLTNWGGKFDRSIMSYYCKLRNPYHSAKWVKSIG